MTRTEFVPVAKHDRTTVATWPSDPLCECPRLDCVAVLPKEAWRYVGSPGQYVALRGHEIPGERVVEMDGFDVVET